jgi:Na+(H+)/acetate symporter ActP
VTLAAALVAVLRPTDMLSLIVWGAAIAAAGLFPVLGLGLRWRRINAAGAVAGMATGLAVAALYIAGTRFLAPEFHALFAGLSDASDSAQRRFLDLQQAAFAARGPERAAARAALEAHAQRIGGWWGLKPAGAALIALPVAFLATVLVSLAMPGARRLPRQDHSLPQDLRRSGSDASDSEYR